MSAVTPSHISISTLEVKRGQNVSLTCNVTSSSTITWYLLRSDQLLPLMTVSKSKLRSGNDIIGYSSVNTSRVMWTGNLKTGLVRLEIEAAEEEDAGLYFCSGWCGAKVYGSRGIYLKFKGINGEGRKLHPPCESHGICVLSGLLGLCSFLMIGLYLCSGKLCRCCWNPWRQDSTLRVAEDDSLHYSSLRHPDKPRPSNKAAPGLVEDLVTYSTVATRKNLNGLHDQR